MENVVQYFGVIQRIFFIFFVPAMTKTQVVARKRQYRQYDENVLSSVIAAIKRKEI